MNGIASACLLALLFAMLGIRHNRTYSMMTEPDSEKLSDEEFPKFLMTIAGAVVTAAIFVIALFVWNFRGKSISELPSDWGTFGDYVGGILNPIVGMATVLLVIISIIIQRRELRASLNEMKAANQAATRMSFEQSLFAWLENYHSQIREIEQGRFKGRKVLLHLYEQVLSPAKTVTCGGRVNLPAPLMPIANDSDANQAYIRLNVPGSEGIKQLGERQLHATLQYLTLYHSHKTDLDAPFRTLFRLIRWIDSSDLTVKDKWHYCTLVRSQLSWPELVFLYYNGLISEGEKLAAYANKYALFDNLLASDELIRFATQELTECPDQERPRTSADNSKWPYTTAAFNSTVAKNILGLPSDF